LRHYKIIFLGLLIFVLSNELFASKIGENLTVQPKSGDGIKDILARYMLDYNKNINFFLEKNKDKIGKNNSIFLHHRYELPVVIARFDGITIRSSINISDFPLAKKIQDYNEELHKKQIKSEDYRKDRILWVPFLELGPIDVLQNQPIANVATSGASMTINPASIASPSAKHTPLKTNELFGDKLKNVRTIDNSLSNHYFYLIAGHGGPDPGAIGQREGNELHEHEYAYDVTLRLARKLLERGAEVFVIVQDAKDGIRDERYLGKSGTEFLINGDTISHIQVNRLKQRIDIINDLHIKNNKSGSKHLVIEIHVDSRITDKQIDIFFYHQPGSEEGERICNILLSTIKGKYEINQPGRGYLGTVTARNLYTLRMSRPVGIYIELGNIQNLRDLSRIIEPNNRQAIANWLLDGILNAFVDDSRRNRR